MPKVQIGKGVYAYITVWDPIERKPKRLYLGKIDNERKLSNLRIIFEPNTESRLSEDMRKELDWGWNLEVEWYFKHDVDPQTGYTKPELAIFWALENYKTIEKISRKSKQIK